MYTGIDLRTIKFLDPSLLQHKLKELFQTGVYEANMYLMLCAINHSQHIHLSKTEPQLSLSLSQLYHSYQIIKKISLVPWLLLHHLHIKEDMIWTWPPPQHLTKPTPQVPKEFRFPRKRHLRGRDFGLFKLSCPRVSKLDANCQGTQWSMMVDNLNCNQFC